MSKLVPSIDLWKFISCILIVFLHCHPLASNQMADYYLTCFCRIAVPFFFISSSFFFFRSGKDIRFFVKRLLILYLCWFIIYLPQTITRIFVNNDNSIYYNSFVFIRGLLIDGTFPASWFITALWQGVLIVWYLSKKTNRKVLYIIGVFCFLLACSRSMYRGFFERDSFWLPLRLFGTIFVPAFSFIVAIPYCIIGKLFADNIFNVVRNKGLFLLASLCIGVLEVYLCRHIGYMTDVYLSLILISPCIFMIILDWDLQMNPELSKYLRNCSILVYLLHLPILYFFRDHALVSAGSPAMFVSVFFCSLAIATLIIIASKKIHVLRYLY